MPQNTELQDLHLAKLQYFVRAVDHGVNYSMYFLHYNSRLDNKLRLTDSPGARLDSIGSPHSTDREYTRIGLWSLCFGSALSQVVILPR